MQPARKLILAAAVAAAAIPSAAHAVGVVGGDLLILRTGDATNSTGSVPVYIDEYTSAGAFVTSYALPSTGALALTQGAGTTTEGNLNLSVDGKYATFAGYRKDAGQATGGSGDAANVSPRVIGRLTLADGSVDSSTVIKTTAAGDADLFGASSVRGVASTDGTHFWVTGVSNPTAGSGLVYTEGLGASAVSTLVQSDNYRGVAIANGDLYVSRASTVRKITGLPTASITAAQVPSIISTASAGQNYESMTFLDLDPTIPGVDTAYVPNSTSLGIEKWFFDTTQTKWVKSGVITTGTAANVLNLTAGTPFFDSGTGNISVPLFFTSTAGGSPATVASIIGTVTDVSLFGAAPTGGVSTLATAPTGTSFHGIVLSAITAAPRLAGDVNGDGAVNAADINVFVFALGTDAAGFAAQYPTGIYTNADVNGAGHAGDGVINAADINPFIAILGGGEPGGVDIAALIAAVPEPTSLGLIALAAMPLVRRRRA